MLIADEVMRKLAPGIKQTAAFLSEAKSGTVLLRWHNDGDGVAAALAISQVLEPTLALQNDSAVYRMANALRDLTFLEGREKPLALFLDFGFNADSLPALQRLKEAGVRLCFIDHHPYPPEAAALTDCFLSPWAVGNHSEYVSGLLSAEVARELGADPARCDYLAQLALTSDFSPFANPSPEEKKQALVLDYLAIKEKFPHDLSFYSDVLRDRQLFFSVYAELEEKMHSIRRLALLVGRKRTIGKFEAVFLDIDKFVEREPFPSKAKAATQAFEALRSDKPFVLIAYGKHQVTFRANRAALTAGFKANKLIEELKEELRAGVRGGGGHEMAGSILLEKDYTSAFLSEIEGKLASLGR